MSSLQHLTPGSTEVRTALSKVKRWHFNPFATSAAEARKWLVRGTRLPTAAEGAPSSAPVEVGEATVFGGVAIVVTNTSGGHIETAEISLEGIEPAFFLSTVSLGEAADGIAERINGEAALAAFHGWDIEIVAAGTEFTTDMVLDRPCCFVSTKKTSGNYFDFVAYQHDKVANYSAKASIPGLAHSGDIGSLLHYLQPNDALVTDSPVVLGVVGFRKQMLRSFASQLPAVCVPSPAERVVRIVPCPLDPASIGDNTMACILSVTRVRGGKLRWVVASRPFATTDVDTATVSADTTRCMTATIDDSRGLIAAAAARRLAEEQQRQQQAAGPLNCADTADQSTATNYGATDEAASPAEVQPHNTSSKTTRGGSKAYTRVILVEESLKDSCVNGALASITGAADGDTLVATFGTGLHIGTDAFPTTRCATVLPCVAGPLTGAAAVALGTAFASPAGLEPAQYLSALRHAALRVVHCTDSMLEQVAPTTRVQLNGVFVLHARRPLNATPTIPGQSPLEAELSDVNVSAVTAMAGPLSVVVIQLRGRRYFYRGVRHAGLLDSVPPFGADVTDLFSDARLQALQVGTFEPPTRGLHSKDDPRVDFLAVGETPSQSVAVLDTMRLHELAANRGAVLRLLRQLQVVLSATELEPVVTRLASRVNDLVAAEVRREEAQFKQAVAARMSPETIADFGRVLREAKRAACAQVQWLVNELGSCLSVKGTATRRHDLNRLRRKAAIASNVADAKSMTQDQLWELLEACCVEDNSCMIAHVDAEKFVQCLSAISNSMQKQTYNALVHHQQGTVHIHARMICIDALTVAALMENTAKAGETMALSPKSNKELSLGIRGVNSLPALPIPLLKAYVALQDPFDTDWLEACNHSDVARLRILLRGTISQSVASRDFNISPAARDIGYAVVDLLFQALQGAIVNAQGAGGVVGTIAFDDTLPQMVRGVLGLILTTMASSARPISKAWQLASRSTLPEAPEGREQWWMYARLASAFPYSCWPQDVFERNLRVLAVRLLQQGVTEPLCVPLRRGSKQVEKQQQKQGKRQHEPRKEAASAAGGAFGTPPVAVNEFAEYLQLCIACLERLATLDGPAAAKAAKAVLRTKPARPSSQRGNASSIFDRVSALLERLASRASSAAAAEGNDDDSDDDADRALLLSLLRNIVQGEVKDVVGGQARAVNRLQQLLLAAPASELQGGKADDAQQAATVDVSAILSVLQTAACDDAIKAKTSQFVADVAQATPGLPLLRVLFGTQADAAHLADFSTIWTAATRSCAGSPAALLKDTVLACMKQWGSAEAGEKAALALLA
jgi:hypothetical protein